MITVVLVQDALPIVGPILSVAFFLIGYRRTVGARKERARAGEAEVQRLLVRRVIVDGYTPSLTDLTRLIEHKARQHRVKVSDLASEGHFMSAIYADVLENEFIATADRDATLERVDNAIREQDREPDKDAAATPEASTRPSRSADRKRVQRQRSSLLAALATLSVVLATTVSAIITQFDNAADATTSREWVAVATASIVLVGLLAALLAFRDRLEEDATPIEPKELSGPEFEAAVEGYLTSAGLRPRGQVARPGAPDFIVDVDGRHIGIEAHGIRRLNRATFRDQLLRAETMLLNSELDDLLLVYPAIPIQLLDEAKERSVRVVALTELADAIRNSATDNRNHSK